ncbi:hypothetical protein FH039_09670 [Thermococcus indicus]|uniref:Uncharacterized protein n=1 Tax=Thermococcus indicus TaxID=2586643 RepID=A0A4Y5SP67_9EURY|nr:hypothetical protein [Thermococcus indicus]QDA31810.1 hypothetical protein FH039_09670 [Thermococcus indicus]
MRRVVVAGIVGLALVLIGIAGPLIMDALGYQYINENRLYLKGQYEIQSLPKNTHVVGHAEGKNFSLYVLDKENLERFKSGLDFEAVYSWRHVANVSFDFRTYDERLYLVIKNELNETQLIKLKLRAGRG